MHYNIDKKLIESYFYKYMADLIWAGDKTVILIAVKDFFNQSDITSHILKLPIKVYLIL